MDLIGASLRCSFAGKGEMKSLSRSFFCLDRC